MHQLFSDQPESKVYRPLDRQFLGLSIFFSYPWKSLAKCQFMTPFVRLTPFCNLHIFTNIQLAGKLTHTVFSRFLPSIAQISTCDNVAKEVKKSGKKSYFNQCNSPKNRFFEKSFEKLKKIMFSPEMPIYGHLCTATRFSHKSPPAQSVSILENFRTAKISKIMLHSSC